VGAVNFIIFGVFAITLFYTSCWVPIGLFWSSLGKKKKIITVIKDQKLVQLIKLKTGLVIPQLKISESTRLFGMMIGIPTRPQLILSRALYESFDKDEIEYVLMHEVGHYKLSHGVKETTVGVILLITGIFILRQSPNLLLAIVLGVVFGIMVIRVGRIFEYQADAYALEKMSNPQGMITATEKFRNYYGRKYTENKNKLISSLFYVGNPYDNRIKMAKEKLGRRF